MVKRFKKYQSGEGNQYVSRLSALHKLQLSLNDFRRLCILKGIYPREPKNRRKAQKGNTAIKILYHKKDINFLLNEKLVWTLRDMKIMNRKIKEADSIGDRQLKRVRLSNYPELKLDHIVKERYPTFIDAIKDLDDCLTLLFLFSTFPALKQVTRSQTALCRRLSVEFMHYVIAAKALRKVFISIKGYYFQADIKGQTVTWIVPHYYPFQPQHKNQVDFRIMSTFVEFYTIMCGFVNFRLYHSLNLIYPPQFSVSLDSEQSQSDESTFVSERIAALNQDIKTHNDSKEEEDQEIDMELMTTDGDDEKVKLMKEKHTSLNRLKSLFQNLKFFINREVPREPLVFIIRCFGGKVSWDKDSFVGATFDETDETITHQIVDRPSIGKQYISRDYIQPQWVFDSVNQGSLLPTNKYFLGAKLPPHLSPFANKFREENDYIPPEEKALRDPSLIVTHEQSDVSDNEEKEPKQTEADINLALEKAYKAEKQIDAKESQNQKKEKKSGKAVAKKVESDNEEEEEIEEEINEDDVADMLGNDSDSEEEKTEQKSTKIEEKLDPEELKIRKREEAKKKMAVKTGKVFKVDQKKEKRLNEQELKLRAKMVKSRHKKLYYKLLQKREFDSKEAKLLETKRKRIDTEKKEQLEKKNKLNKQKQKAGK